MKVEEVRIERRPYQFLYKDDMGYNFMHTETFEQVAIPARASKVLNSSKEGDVCEAMVHAASDTILTCEMPMSVVLEITYTEPASKATQPPIHSNPPQWKPAPKYAFPFSAT